MSDAIISVDVPLGDRAYAIHIGPGAIGRLGDEVGRVAPARRAAIITDQTVAALHAHRLIEPLAQAGVDGEFIVIPPGEASKSLAQASGLYDRLAARRHARNEPIIALGGGVVGDLAGFVASTWMRGVPWVQCPTTMEAAVDAAVGGKTGVNHAAGKNLIGAFHQPRVVLADTACLATLSDRDYRAGLAESVKHALVRDEAFLAWHEENADRILSRDDATVSALIRRNCEIKAAIVAADERESGGPGIGRAALNVGHTIGHALEADATLALRHGEAVALGLVVELDLAVRVAGFDAAARDRIERLLGRLGLPLKVPGRQGLEAAVLGRTLLDKKNREQTTRWVLPMAIGQLGEGPLPTETLPELSLKRIIGP